LGTGTGLPNATGARHNTSITAAKISTILLSSLIARFGQRTSRSRFDRVFQTHEDVNQPVL
jgi:hypothetical protein